MFKSNSFAAFIITYERPAILNQTIETILSQTLPPSKILIVDNSISFDTHEIIQGLDSPLIIYHRVGYNAGPAGAAQIGLLTLANEGYDWIYWGDDNDPPKFSDCFERLLTGNIQQTPRLGAVGATGSYLNPYKGVLTKVKDSQINTEEFVLVDTIAGGMCLLVSGKAIREGVNTDEKLFFAFEELDLALSLKKNGFVLAIESDLARRYRKSARYPDRAGKDIRTLFIEDDVKLARVYYSLRNFIIIMLKHRYYFGVMAVLSRKLAKIIVNLLLKPNRASLNYFTIHVAAIKDALIKRMGYTFDLKTSVRIKSRS